MIYVQCTKAVQRELCIYQPLDIAPRSESALGNWTLNIVPLGHRRAYLFMSDRSLLSFPVMVGQRTIEMHRMADLLAHGLSQLIEILHAPRHAVARLLRDTDVVALARTASRSLLAVHSALAADYSHHVERAGGIEGCNLDEIIVAVNEAPRARLNWVSSFEVTRTLLQEAVV